MGWQDAPVVSAPTGASPAWAQAPVVADEPSLIDKIKAIPGHIAEAVTGAERRTPETEAAPDWADMPELNSFSMASAKTGLGTLLASPEEAVKVIQANFPGVQARQDERGNFFVQSSIDGKEYAFKPGFRPSDIPRAAAGVAAFTPAGRATSVMGAGAAAAGTQAVIEGTQAATGGTFDPAPVGAAGVLGAAVPAIGGIVRAVRGRSPTPLATPPAAPPATPPAATLSPDELGQTARSAALGGFGSKKATATLAAEAAPDAATVEAAKRLGVMDHLQPDHVTTNQAFRQLSQLVKSQTGSQAHAAQRAGLEKVAQAADDIVTKIGGSKDLSTVSENVASQLKANHAALKDQAARLYGEVADAINPSSPVRASNLAAQLRKNADDLGGEANLSAVESRLLRQLDENPTYALLDKVRKDIGEARRGKMNAFGSSNSRELTILESALRADQKAAADAAGVGQTWELAQATAKTYKGIQDDLTAIFGRDLDKSMQPLLTGAVKKLAAGDTSNFVKLLKSVPEDMRQQVTASGLSSFFQKTARGGEMDFAGYAKWYEGLQRNQQAYNAVMSNLPKRARQQLADLAKVSRGVAMSKGEFIATGKAINPRVLEAADTLMSRVYEAVKQRGIPGLVAESLGTAHGAPGLASALQSAMSASKPSVMQAADRLIASPEFIAAVQAAGTSAAPAAARRLAYSHSFTRYARALGNPREMSNREQWVLRAMESANSGQYKKAN